MVTNPSEKPSPALLNFSDQTGTGQAAPDWQLGRLYGLLLAH